MRTRKTGLLPFRVFLGYRYLFKAKFTSISPVSESGWGGQITVTTQTQNIPPLMIFDGFNVTSDVYNPSPIISVPSNFTKNIYLLGLP